MKNSSSINLLLITVLILFIGSNNVMTSEAETCLKSQIYSLQYCEILDNCLDYCESQNPDEGLYSQFYGECKGPDNCECTFCKP
ncbi:hypothetical protein QQ045_007916 [Rhodiola kirilowii]